MQSIQTWKLIHESLERAIPVMLLYVLESKGSSPGRQGFFMAVNINGDMEGSVGGGMMEHKFVEMAKNSLQSAVGSRQSTADSYMEDSRQSEASVRKQVHDKSARKDQSGMICSGEQTILLYHVREPDLSIIQRIIVSLEQNKNGTLILSPAGLQFEDAIPSKDFGYSYESEDNWLYREKTGYKNQLYVIGGGHCSLAFSRLMRSMDFYIRVYDERKDLKTMIENESAHEKFFVDSYAGLKEMIPSGQNSYVVIMTFGYRTDDIVLRALLGKEFKYIGLLGSQTKIEKMFDDYRKEGIKDELLQPIHSPVGLAIKSQTPEEIAVSIAAEIISIKNHYL